MKAQIVEQIEFFSEAELESLEFLPEELEAIEEERVPDLDSISFEDIAKELEAYFERDIEGAQLERKRGGKKPSKPEEEEIRMITYLLNTGVAAGRAYANAGGHQSTRLPKAPRGEEYLEFDLGFDRYGNRGRHRLVILAQVAVRVGRVLYKAYYTVDHYEHFTELKHW
ncbi:ribonuclease domain-containing protein [Nostoc sp. NMS4]|uniref:ribonuclease domain-containing protein n=1 Tax=Nostoc sp. NMS4 TaxID=2815390 RepID=UPI0026010D47|nr:ribonuclease domain-containing protein [Nostoc sp. NMS4]MBN3927005.1 hypothetical protein [Nostoc sp. NMS4]